MNGVTCIIPVYNPRRDWFEQCLASIPNRFADVIICDDCSDVPVPEATYRHDVNLGLCKTKNDLMKRVRTKWVVKIDCDDYFDSDGVNALLDILDTIDTDLIHWPYRFVPCGEVWSGDDVSLETVKHLCSAPINWHTKEHWKRNRGFQYPLCEDWDFLLRSVKNGATFHYFPKVVYNYRLHEDGLYQKVIMKNRRQIRTELWDKYGFGIPTEKDFPDW